MEINSIDELVKLAGLVKQQELATEAEVEEDCGCADEPQAVMTKSPDMYAILQRLSQMGEVHEDEVTEEWANSTEHFDGEDRITDLPKGEPVDTSLRRHLGANAQPVRVEEAIQDHTVEDMMEAYTAFKTDAIEENSEVVANVTEGRVKDSVIDDSENMSKEEFTKKHGKELADEMYESIEEATVMEAHCDCCDSNPCDCDADCSCKMNESEAKVDEAEVEEDNAFNTAAANAKKAGKSEFEFNGKKYKVKMDAKTADALTDDVEMLRKLAGL
jgi:hypothetical protein